MPCTPNESLKLKIKPYFYFFPPAYAKLILTLGTYPAN